MNNFIILLPVIFLIGFGVYTFLYAIPMEKEAEILAAKEAAESWKEITDCDKIVSSYGDIVFDRNFIGKYMILDAIQQASERNNCESWRIGSP